MKIMLFFTTLLFSALTISFKPPVCEKEIFLPDIKIAGPEQHINFETSMETESDIKTQSDSLLFVHSVDNCKIFSINNALTFCGI